MEKNKTHKLEVFGLDGKVRETIELEYGTDYGRIESPGNAAIVKNAIEAQLSNKRTGTISTKVRSEVSGGGKKPWKQKGLGRARAGSIRSPLWRGGGVVFGPHPRNFGRELPKRTRRRAIILALIDRMENGRLKVLDCEIEKPDTGSISAFMSTAGCDGNVLVVCGDNDRNFELSCRNISGIKVLKSSLINVYDIVRSDFIVASGAGIKTIIDGYFKKAEGEKA